VGKPIRATRGSYDYGNGTNLTPASQKQQETLREQEKARQKWDKSYVTAEQARSIPKDLLATDPMLRARVEHSQPDWPEHRANATQALGPLEGGQGETVESRPTAAEDLFTGGRVEE
jgi:hypothetical protein